MSYDVPLPPSLTELPKAAMKILSNMTFLFISLSYTAECAIVTAFITFIPKFIESQFGIPASSASIYTGEPGAVSLELPGALVLYWYLERSSTVLV